MLHPGLVAALHNGIEARLHSCSEHWFDIGSVLHTACRLCLQAMGTNRGEGTNIRADDDATPQVRAAILTAAVLY